MPHKAVYSQPFEQIGWPKYTMNILAAHLNTSRATEMYLTKCNIACTVNCNGFFGGGVKNGCKSQKIPICQ